MTSIPAGCGLTLMVVLRITYTVRRTTYAEGAEMTDQPAIEAERLTKTYREVSVLDGVSFQVPRGTVFCLLGPNGAGKTTTVRILATLTSADSGSARVDGLDVRRDRSRVRRRISLTGQYAALDELQTGVEN